MEQFLISLTYFQLSLLSLCFLRVLLPIISLSLSPPPLLLQGLPRQYSNSVGFLDSAADFSWSNTQIPNPYFNIDNKGIDGRIYKVKGGGRGRERGGCIKGRREYMYRRGGGRVSGL